MRPWRGERVGLRAPAADGPTPAHAAGRIAARPGCAGRCRRCPFLQGGARALARAARPRALVAPCGRGPQHCGAARAGKPPFNGANHVQLLRNIERAEAALPAAVAGALSPRCRALLHGLLRRNPLERISFEEFFAHAFLAGPGDGAAAAAADGAGGPGCSAEGAAVRAGAGAERAEERALADGGGGAPARWVQLAVRRFGCLCAQPGRALVGCCTFVRKLTGVGSGSTQSAAPRSAGLLSMMGLHDALPAPTCEALLSGYGRAPCSCRLCSSTG